MKIIYVLPYSLAAKALLLANLPALVEFDNQFADPYIAHVLDPAIDSAAHIIGPLSLQNRNQSDTEARNLLMDQVLPLLKSLSYKVGQCIKDGSITLPRKSFCIGPFERSITKKDINRFHANYEIVIPLITANQTALTAKGFTVDNTKRITDLHHEAMGLQTEKIDLKEQISDLSIANQKTINDLLDEIQKIINALKAMADATSNKELAQKATKKAILKTVVPTPVRTPRRRSIPPATSIIITSTIPAKNILQFTLLTDQNVTLCRTALKTDPPIAGITLVLNKLWEGKKADIPGTGNFIKLTNHSTSKKAAVLYFQVNANL